MLLRSSLLLTAAVLAPATAFAQAVPSEPSASQSAAMSDEEAEEGETVVVTGQRPRGSVVGDIPPEDVLTQRDIRATGATSISELLDAVAAADRQRARPHVGPTDPAAQRPAHLGFPRASRPAPRSDRADGNPARGSRPQIWLCADARVVNIVLRQRFNSTSAEARVRAATDGGFVAGQSDATKLLIRNGQRTSLNLRARRQRFDHRGRARYRSRRARHPRPARPAHARRPGPQRPRHRHPQPDDPRRRGRDAHRRGRPFDGPQPLRPRQPHLRHARPHLEQRQRRARARGALERGAVAVEVRSSVSKVRLSRPKRRLSLPCC